MDQKRLNEAQAEAKAEIEEAKRRFYNPTPEEQARRVEARKELAKARAEDAAEIARAYRQEPTPEQLAAQDQFLDELAKPAPPVRLDCKKYIRTDIIHD